MDIKYENYKDYMATHYRYIVQSNYYGKISMWHFCVAPEIGEGFDVCVWKIKPKQ